MEDDIEKNSNLIEVMNEENSNVIINDPFDINIEKFETIHIVNEIFQSLGLMLKIIIRDKGNKLMYLEHNKEYINRYIYRCRT